MPILNDNDLAELRAISEGEMVDSCVITPTAAQLPQLDPDTLTYPDTAPTSSVYDGPCELVEQPSATTTGVTDSGLTQTVLVKLPVAGTDDVRPGHFVRITAAANDPASVHRRFRVDAIGRFTFSTARRLRCTELTGEA